MSRNPPRIRSGAALLALLLAAVGLRAAEHKGQVLFGGLPVPGVTVTAVQGEKRLATVTDSQGNYTFRDLPDGSWTLQVEMLGFSTVKREVPVAADAPSTQWDLKMLPLAEIKAEKAP